MDIIQYTEEHRMFRDTLRKFVEKELIPHVEEWEEAGIVPAFTFYGDKVRC